MVGTNWRLQNWQLAGHLEMDLSVLRPIRYPLRNNLLQGQRSPQAPLLVSQLVRFGSRKRRNNVQEAKCRCSKGMPFSLSIDVFSFDDSIINYRYSSPFIPRATPHCVSSLPISRPMPRDAPVATASLFSNDLINNAWTTSVYRRPQRGEVATTGDLGW